MEPRDIAKLLTGLDYNDGMITEQVEPAAIPEGDGPFRVYFNRGTVVIVNHIAASDSNDPNLFYAGIDPSDICFKTNSPKTPLSMVMMSDREQAKEFLGIDVPRRKHIAPFKHVITFNAKNVLKVERINPAV